MNKIIEIIDILKHLDEKKFSYEFKGNKNENIKGFSTLFNYKEKTVTFISTLYKFEKYKQNFSDKSIQLILIDPSENHFQHFENIIIIEKPTNAFFSIIEKFYSNDRRDTFPIYNKEDNLRKGAFIDKKSNIGMNVKIGHGCIIEEGVTIGDNTEIHHNVIIRSGSIIGQKCKIKSGTIIGEEGFNPYTLKNGSKKLIKHFGGVRIGDTVHIGPNCNIHKGSIDDTIIKSGVKLNAKVHIAHNSIIGEDTVITMPTAIGGSVKIGKNCHIAANVIRNQCSIGDSAVLGLGAVVVKDVLSNSTVVGNPARKLIK